MSLENTKFLVEAAQTRVDKTIEYAEGCDTIDKATINTALHQIRYMLKNIQQNMKGLKDG